MSDDEPLETYTPRRTHHLSVEEELPHSDEPRTLRYQLKEGTTYDVLEGEEADEKLGRAPVNNVTGCVRRSALPDHAS